MQDGDTRAAGAQAVLDAAEALFAERGFDGISMAAIARRAGVSKATVFHHFGTKEALYLAVVRRACRRTSELIRSLDEGGEPLETGLGRLAQTHLASLLEQGAVARLILRELLTGRQERARTLAEEVFGDDHARIVAYLERAQARGELAADVEPGLLVTVLFGAEVLFFLARDVLRHLPATRALAEDPARFAAGLARLLLRGAAPREAGR
ncbi:TetR/AcrR family transcriptional regulator [Inmirania thermothiophila]|uniref:TetR family transcriptional regulator n=1 Tax=Inmirania thermothiophila TaxID=1750597 RepID=A0A3N1Y1I4_9GAMM|nr:TetR/AcrR family transcriptional regulator [Inmirania thermothiophila]ROR32401.1 TetR family transcriptional regulator [Inmirania thermothiophila]